MSAPSPQRPQRSYVVQAAVIERDAWQGMPSMPDAPAACEHEPLPLPEDDYAPSATGTRRVAPAPAHTRRAAPVTTGVVEKQVGDDADSLIARFAREEDDANVCAVFARMQGTAGEPAPGERALLTVVAAASRQGRGVLVLAATNLLLRLHPDSFGLPTALMAAAEQQLAMGRVDLARRTLEHVRDQYPMSMSAFQAEDRLRRLPR